MSSRPQRRGPPERSRRAPTRGGGPPYGAAERAGGRSSARDEPPPRVDSFLPKDVVRDIVQAGGETRGREALRLADRAVQLIAEREPDRAVGPAERAKSLVPRSAALREILALAFYGAGNWRAALREMQAYRRMSGRLDENHVIADCYRALGKPERALEEAESAIAADDLDDEVKAESAVVGASALADAGRLEQALSFLKRVRTQPTLGRPFDLRVWYVAGDILARLGRREEAAREFLRIVRHDAGAFDAADRLKALA